jgi:hypothetical protein
MVASQALTAAHMPIRFKPSSFLRPLLRTFCPRICLWGAKGQTGHLQRLRPEESERLLLVRKADSRTNTTKETKHIDANHV